LEFHLISRRYHRKYQISWVSVTTESGSIVIQSNHAPLIASIAQKTDCTFLIDNGTTETLLIQQGTVEVTRSRVTLLIHEE
jgi:F0F1-type ATP synthase epsilon subunit